MPTFFLTFFDPAPISKIVALKKFASSKAHVSYGEHVKKWLVMALLVALPIPVFAADDKEAAKDATRAAKIALNLPPGFSANLFAKLPVLPRMLAFDATGNLYVTSTQSNALLKLTDSNGDGVADSIKTVTDQLNAPNGLAFVGSDLLVANQDGVVKLKSQKDSSWSKPQPWIRSLPTGGHTVKTIKLGPDGFIYLNVGSSCNVCVENDATRASLLRYSAEGKPAGALAVVGQHSTLPPIWATGLRNSQGFAWQPGTNDMFATNNGADMRSGTKNGAVNDELPPEHLNRIVAGHHYGWPYCWANPADPKQLMQDPNFTRGNISDANVSDGGPAETDFCKQGTAPAITFTSHSTPIGLTFLNNSGFPAAYRQDAIVALHGSWNRQQLSGYKLVRVKFKDHQPTGVEDFASGWLVNNQAWGRPVDVAVGPDGALYVSDDRTGNIYRISYQKP